MTQIMPTLEVVTDKVGTDIFRPERRITSATVQYYQRNALSLIVVMNPDPIGVKKSPVSVN